MEIQFFQETVAVVNELHSHKPYLVCQICKRNKNITFSKKYFSFLN